MLNNENRSVNLFLIWSFNNKLIRPQTKSYTALKEVINLSTKDINAWLKNNNGKNNLSDLSRKGYHFYTYYYPIFKKECASLLKAQEQIDNFWECYITISSIINKKFKVWQLANKSYKSHTTRTYETPKDSEDNSPIGFMCRINISGL